MAITVRVPGPLRRLTAGSAEVTVKGGTVAEALADLEAQHPGFRERLHAEDGQLRPFINLYVNDTDVRFGNGLETELKGSDEISIVPAVAGG